MHFLEIVDARKHNLRHINLTLPKKKLIVICGISGSGKSSLAFDTIFQEGQRRFLESLSSYARQFIKSMEQPEVAAIRGISPTVAIDQKHSAFHFNSTLGTITEITPFLRLLLAKAGEAHCPQCGRPIHSYSHDQVLDYLYNHFHHRLVRIFSPLVKRRKGVYHALLERYRQRGFLKVRIDGQEYYLEALPELDRQSKHDIYLAIDSLELEEKNRWQVSESLARALEEGNGEILLVSDVGEQFFSSKLYCNACAISLREPQPGSFSFFSPEGACPQCFGQGSEQNGVTCALCSGSGLNREALSFFIGGKNIFALGEMEAVDLLKFFKRFSLPGARGQIAERIVPQIVRRLDTLCRLNLGYISLNRRRQTLSGGELQRARLVSQLGLGMTGIIYILDEPSIGMHISEQLYLVDVLKQLRDKGNTVIVVEHDEETIRAADFIVDMGPGAGEHGGEVVFAGTGKRFAKAKHSLTADYLSGRRRMNFPRNGSGKPAAWLTVAAIKINNIKGLDLRLPWNRLVAVTGVSGSGKSSLVVDALYNVLQQEFAGTKPVNAALRYGRVSGLPRAGRVLLVNQAAIGKNSRSCPATYIGIMAMIRELFAGLVEAKIRGYKAKRFSFNVRGGRCEACEGLGVRYLEMGFLPAVEVECSVCEGRRFNSETLLVKYRGHSIADVLNLTAHEAGELFASIHWLAKKIRVLIDVGLGYLRLGQSSVTLSGGESQRIKLTRELAKTTMRPTVYLLDEPTVGLHFEDIRQLLTVFQALIARGHTVVVIEHNLDVIGAADWIVDLGPGGGRHGGNIVFQGDSRQLARCRGSLTGRYLREKMVHELR